MTQNIKKINLEDLGYDTFFGSDIKKSELADYKIARIIAEYKEAYKARSLDGEYLAKISGKHAFHASSRNDYPAVGDWVLTSPLDPNTALINRILPRKTILRKKYSNKQDSQIIATNIDVAFIIESLDRDYNLNRFERYLVLIKDGHINPAIVLNKIDLISDAELDEIINKIKNRFKNIDIFPTSSFLKRGVNELRQYIRSGNTYCFLGSSGVGKSSLINELLENNTIKTGEISHRTGRGKHTTTSRETYFLENGGILIDNPGMREVGMADSEEGINDVFEEISILSKNCKFANCTHTHEPGCAILKAVESEELDERKYSNYLKLKKEAEYYSMTKLEKRRKDQQFGKFLKKSLEQLKRFESRDC